MLLRSAPWRRAPLLLLRSPGVFLACAAAMAALAIAVASGGLFLASAGTGALRDLAGESCPESTEPGIIDNAALVPTGAPSVQRATLRRGDATIRTALHHGGLTDPDLVLTTSAPASAAPTDLVTVFARAGARDHVDVVRRGGGAGVWVPQSYAASRHLRIGSTLPLGASKAAVSGIYRDIAPSAFDPEYTLPRYWCTWATTIVPTIDHRPPPLVLADADVVTGAGTAMNATWYVPTDVDHRTVPQVQDTLNRTIAAVTGIRPSGIFRTTPDLSMLLAKAERERAGLGGATVPINVAGTVAAALLVAAAGGFWGLRRQAEIRLLHSRGVGRVAIGVKAILEIGPAIAVGTIGGWLAAIGLVVALGPAAQLEPGAVWSALLVCAVAGCGALLAAGVMGARTAPSDTRMSARWLWFVPWEVGLLAASVVTYHDVRAHGSVQVASGTIRIDPLVLSFPLLALTGGVLLLARLSATGLRRVGTLGAHLSAAPYLALRRLAGTPAVAIGTIVGVAVPLGVLVYAAALSGSTDASVRAKYETNVGAPHVFGTLADPGSTPAVGNTGTVVSMLQIDTRIDGGRQVRVIGVDPATFPTFAYGGERLRPTLDLLTAHGGRVAAVLVNAPTGTHATTLSVRGERIAISVVGTRSDFPGERDPFRPVLVVDRAALPRHLPLNTDRVEEVWTDDAHEAAAITALHTDHVTPSYEVTPQTFLSGTGLRPVTWIFGYLRALAYLIGMIAVTALAFAFTSRTRRRAFSYHLSRRMGLSRVRHRRSIAIEVGSLVGLSWVIGVGLAVASIALVYVRTDPYPAFPPPPGLPVPVATITATAALAVAAVIVAAAALQWVIDRIRPAELLRG